MSFYFLKILTCFTLDISYVIAFIFILVYFSHKCINIRSLICGYARVKLLKTLLLTIYIEDNENSEISPLFYNYQIKHLQAKLILTINPSATINSSSNILHQARNNRVTVLRAVHQPAPVEQVASPVLL